MTEPSLDGLSPSVPEPVLAVNTRSELIKKYLKCTGGLLIIVFVLSVAGYFIYKNVVPAATPQQGVDLSPAAVIFEGQKLPEKPFDFKGTLYLSLRKINGTFDLGIYAFNINGAVGSKFTTIFADKISKDGDYNVYISPSVSSDGTKLVFARGNASVPGFQIFTSDISGKNVQQVTNTPDKYKREPVFSPSGNLIAYISYNAISSASDSDKDIPENWSTYVTDLKGNEVKVADGSNPIFSPDGGKLLVLQNDGLHAFDISVWTSPKHLGPVAKMIGGVASQTMKIAVSADGKMISWSSIKTGNVIVSRINSWDEFSISPFLTIYTRAFWSAFSPDGKYLAVDELRKDASGTEYPVIMGYDLSNGTSEKIVTLISNDKSYLWLGIWK